MEQSVLILLSLAVIALSIVDGIQKRIIRVLKKSIDDAVSRNDEILNWCLRYILKDSLRDEVQDYETAQKCANLLKDLSNRPKKPVK